MGGAYGRRVSCALLFAAKVNNATMAQARLVAQKDKSGTPGLCSMCVIKLTEASRGPSLRFRGWWLKNPGRQFNYLNSSFSLKNGNTLVSILCRIKLP